MMSRACRRCVRPMVAQLKPIPTGHVMHIARELCQGCHSWALYHGCLLDYPRRTRPGAEVIEEHEFLTRQGLNDAQIAARLGMTLDGLETALRRHRIRERAA